MSSDQIVIDVKNLSKRYEIYATPRDRLKQLLIPSLHKIFARIVNLFGGNFNFSPPQYFQEFWALHDVSFQIKKGEAVGIIGRNGSGKSTLLQIICSTLSPTSGDVNARGRISALLELGSGFNPMYTGKENVFLNARILGLNQAEIVEHYDSIINFADLGDFIDQPIKTYSTGMVVRLAFAVAIHVDPEILVIDEALAVGDSSFQRKCMVWIERYISHGGTLIFVSHSSEQVRRLCKHAVYLTHGRMVAFGSAKSICDLYEEESLNKSSPPIPDVKDNLPVKTYSSQNNIQPITEFPKCAVQYGSLEAKILDAWTEDASGRLTSSFVVGDKIVWCYRIFFSAAVDYVDFGMMLKTKEGINLCSINSQTMGYKSESFEADISVLVKFEINPNLGQGVYYFNCGVSTTRSGEVYFIHRVVDAGIINVHAINPQMSGLVDMAVAFHSTALGRLQ